jgi:hypothetical protein
MTKNSASGGGVPGGAARCRGCEPATGSARTSRARPLHHPLQRFAQPILALFRAVSRSKCFVYYFSYLIIYIHLFNHINTIHSPSPHRL